MSAHACSACLFRLVACLFICPASSRPSLAHQTLVFRSGGGHLKPARGYTSVYFPRGPSFRVADQGAERKWTCSKKPPAAPKPAAALPLWLAFPRSGAGPRTSLRFCFLIWDRNVSYLVRYIGRLWSWHTFPCLSFYHPSCYFAPLMYLIFALPSNIITGDHIK